MVEVVNWSKYNPRMDSKKPNWFRVDTDVVLGDRFFGLDCDHRWLWIYILAIAMKHQGAPFLWHFQYCAALTGISPAKQRQALDVFKKSQRIRTSVRDSHEVVRDSPATGQDRTLQDKTEEGGETQKSEADFQRPEKPKSLKASRADALPPLAALWNATVGPAMPKVVGCSSTRRRLAEARWRDKPDGAYWGTIMARIATSGFCNGKNDRGWKATFDWFIRPETQHKILEGHYDNRTGGSGNAINWDRVFGTDGSGSDS